MYNLFGSYVLITK